MGETIERPGFRQGPPEELMPSLIENKSLPTYMQDRVKLAGMYLGKTDFDGDFISSQLESNDFVNRYGALKTVARTEDIPDDQKKHLASKIKPLVDDDDRGVQEAAVESLGNLDDPGLEFLNELTSGRHKFWIRRKALTTMGGVGSKALPKIREKKDHVDYRIRQSAAKALGKVGEEALPDLQEMLDDTDARVKTTAIMALGEVGEKAYPILKDWVDDPRHGRSAITALGKTGVKALPLLKKRSKKKTDLNTRRSAILSMGEVGVKALPRLQELLDSPDPRIRQVTLDAIQGMEGIPESRQEKLAPEIKPLIEDSNRGVRETAEKVYRGLKNEKPGMDQFINSRESYFANPYGEDTREKLSKLAGISSELRREFKKDYVGFTVLGSTFKGYRTRESDIDYAVIAGDKEAGYRFREKCSEKNLVPCEMHIQVNPKETDEYREKLFQGMFFGDREKLEKLQGKQLRSMEAGEWDELRRKLIQKETKYRKLRRLRYTSQEIQTISQARKILYSPPDYQTMKNQLGVE